VKDPKDMTDDEFEDFLEQNMFFADKRDSDNSCECGAIHDEYERAGGTCASCGMRT
jgi:hypothetical protein